MDKPILCLDFDGVCHTFTSGWEGIDVISDPAVPGLFEFLEEACKVFDIQVFSSRSSEERGIVAMQLWFVEQRKKWRERGGQGAEVLEISFPKDKPPAFIGLDDRVMMFTGEWPKVDMMKKFEPWHKNSKKTKAHKEGIDRSG